MPFQIRWRIRNRLRSMQNLNPARIVVSSFGVIILLGTLLLMLPVASRDGQATDPLTCLFTATSASCVTGLILVDTWAHWTLFGQVVILAMIQLGGLGFMTVITLVSFALRRRIGLSERLIMVSTLNLNDMDGVVRVVRHALMGTFLIEGTGAVVLTLCFLPRYGFLKGLWRGIFHAVSAFCNAGFDLLDGFDGFRHDHLVGGTLIALIVLGGIGFIVWDDIVNLVLRHKSLSVYTKLVLRVTAVLILSGTALIAFFEWNNVDTIGGMNTGEKIFQSLFQSVTTRTAGIDLIGNTALTDSSKLICMFLMLIGGASGSTAGGVKVGTLGVIVMAVMCSAAGRSEIRFSKRRIPSDMVVRAITVLTINLSAGLFGGLLISAREGVPLMTSMYETISAISTVGLSLSLSPYLSAFSMVVDMLLMFFGRVGILTVTYSIMLSQARRDSCISYPDADLLIG